MIDWHRAVTWLSPGNYDHRIVTVIVPKMHAVDRGETLAPNRVFKARKRRTISPHSLVPSNACSTVDENFCLSCNAESPMNAML